MRLSLGSIPAAGAGRFGRSCGRRHCRHRIPPVRRSPDRAMLKRQLTVAPSSITRIGVLISPLTTALAAICRRLPQSICPSTAPEITASDARSCPSLCAPFSTQTVVVRFDLAVKAALDENVARRVKGACDLGLAVDDGGGVPRHRRRGLCRGCGCCSLARGRLAPDAAEPAETRRRCFALGGRRTRSRGCSGRGSRGYTEVPVRA